MEVSSPNPFGRTEEQSATLLPESLAAWLSGRMAAGDVPTFKLDPDTGTWSFDPADGESLDPVVPQLDPMRFLDDQMPQVVVWVRATHDEFLGWLTDRVLNDPAAAYKHDHEGFIQCSLRLPKKRAHTQPADLADPADYGRQIMAKHNPHYMAKKEGFRRHYCLDALLTRLKDGDVMDETPIPGAVWLSVEGPGENGLRVTVGGASICSPYLERLLLDLKEFWPSGMFGDGQNRGRAEETEEATTTFTETMAEGLPAVPLVPKYPSHFNHWQAIWQLVSRDARGGCKLKDMTQRLETGAYVGGKKNRVSTKTLSLIIRAGLGGMLEHPVPMDGVP